MRDCLWTWASMDSSWAWISSCLVRPPSSLISCSPNTTGKLGTPVLADEASHETIRPSFETAEGDRVPVIALDWQVEGKLAAWFSRRKNSDFDDLLFLFRTYGKEIARWSGRLQNEWRVEFMEAYKLEPVSEKEYDEMKRTLHLED
jgi:hypothetical protein